MANRNKKKGSTKPTSQQQQQRRPRRGQSSRNGVTYAKIHEEHIYRTVNPFHPDGEGQLYPDSQRLARFGLRQTTTGTITTGAGGIGAQVFRPCNDLIGQMGFTPAASLFTVPDPLTGVLINSDLASVGGKMRLISAGVRWWFIGSADTAGGILTLAAEDQPSQLVGSMSSSTVQEHRLTTTDLKKPGAYIFKLVGEPDAFTPITTSGLVDDVAIHCDSLMLHIDGPVSSKCLAWEIVVNYEVILGGSYGALVGNKVRHETAHIVKPYHNQISGVFSGDIRDIFIQLRDEAKAKMIETLKVAGQAGVQKLITGASEELGALLL